MFTQLLLFGDQLTVAHAQSAMLLQDLHLLVKDKLTLRFCANVCRLGLRELFWEF